MLIRFFKIALITFGILGFACSLILFLGARTISQEFLQIPEAELTLVALSPSIFLYLFLVLLEDILMGGKLKSNSKFSNIRTIF